MRIVFSFVFCILFSAAFGQAHAQDCQIEKRATLPINYERFLPTTAIMINGHSVNMGIDTGAENTFITPEAAADMNLPNDPHHFTKSIGTGGSKIVNNVMVDDISFGLAHVAQQSMAVVSLQTSRMGVQDFGPTLSLAGVLGGDILSRYDIEYDAVNRTLSLYSVVNCAQISPPWDGDYMQVPVILTAHKRLVMPVVLDGQPVTGLFDTGSSGLELARSSAYKVGLTADTMAADPTILGSGVNNQSYQAPIHMFDSMAIARELYRSLRVSIVDFPPSDADMLIGENYMNAHRFWLSYSTGMIFIQRAAAQ